MNYLKSLQLELDTLYLEYINKIMSNPDTFKALCNGVLSSPLFIDLNVSYSQNITEHHKKILIVGKETNGWNNELGKRLPFSSTFSKENYLEELKKTYVDLNYSSDFWRFIKNYLIPKFENKYKNVTFLYTNLSRHDESQGAVKTDKYFDVIHDNDNAIFRNELKIINPDCVIFLTGPHRDYLINKTFQDIQFQDIDKWKIYDNGNCFIRKVNSSILKNAFRIYHPDSYNRTKPKICNELGIEDCNIMELLSIELLELINI